MELSTVLEHLLAVQQAQLETLQRISESLERLTPTVDIVRDLADYPGFDWPSIGAEVIATDKHGAVAVRHNGKIYTRRNPTNKFGIAVWYSRATGKDENGTSYEKLITFKPVAIECEPLNEKTVAALRSLKRQSA
jgi:hypothetical protein